MSKARDLADSAQEINILDGKSFLDEDNLASDSATGIASQQSIKAYVDGITTTNITSTGALNSGSITSGFGNINNGSSTITTTGAITGGSFVIGSADINENDLESIDGITAGTVAASKAVVVNANKDITGFRNLTATGTISGTLSGAIASTTTATTQAESDDSTKVATTAYVVDKITTLIGGAPSTLNDLNELAAAINDDANYNSTLTTALATKLPLAGGALTGAVTTNSTFDGRNVSVDGSKLDGIEANATADQTAAQILTALKTVDGSGSGLDADLIDGLSSGDLIRSNAADVKSSGDLNFSDSVKATFGASSDLQIYHDGSHSYVKDAGTGNLKIQGENVAIENTSGDLALYYVNTGVNLYHNNSAKLATTSTGISVTGNIANASGDLTLDVAGDIILDAGGADIHFKDDGTTFAEFDFDTPNFRIKNPVSDGDILLQGVDGGSSINALTLDMSEAGKATFSNGLIANGDISLGDSKYLLLGNANDFQIFHNGADSYLFDNGTGNLNLTTNGASINLKKHSGGENMLVAVPDGSVSLYHNNSKKIETTSSGVTVTGTVAATSYTGSGANLTGIVAGRTYGTTATTTSGTSFTFTGIPAGVYEVNLLLNQVKISGGYGMFLRLGTSSGIVSSGYQNQGAQLMYSGSNAALPNVASDFDTGFSGQNDGQNIFGYMKLTRSTENSNTWIYNAHFTGRYLSSTNYTANLTGLAGGIITLGGELTQIQIIRERDGKTFTNGSATITWSQ